MLELKSLEGLNELTDLVGPYRGKDIPANAEEVTWKNGLVTCLPWTVGAQGELWVSKV